MNGLRDHWELPSDAAMIDWVEKRSCRVVPAAASEQHGQWLVYTRQDLFMASSKGATWREAVEEAMRKEGA